MAIKSAGVRLSYEDFAKFVTQGGQANQVYQSNKAAIQQLVEAERQATNAVKGATQQRTAASVAESKERVAAATRIIESEKRQTIAVRQEAQAQVAARQQAARAAQQAAQAQAAAQPAGGGGLGALGGIGRTALGFGLGLLGVQSVQQTIGTTIELDRMAAQSRVTNIALTALAGGGGQAAEAIRQIQSVAPGSTNALEAAGAATTILTQKLNSSAVSVGEISKAIAIIPQLSPSIKSTGDALAQLTLFASSNAFARADQLLVTADEVKNRIQELQAAYPGLTDAQAKAAATVQLVNERFKEVGSALAENVPGVQKLTTAFEDLKLAVATGAIGPVDRFLGGIAAGINAATVASGGGTLATQQQALADLRGELEAQQKIAEQRPVNLADAILPGINSGAFEQSLGRLGVLEKEMERANELAATGAPAALEYQKALQGIVAAVVDSRGFTAEQGAQLAEIRDRYIDVSRAAEVYADAQEKAAQAQAAIAAATNLAELNEVRAQIDELAKSSLDLFAQGAPGADDLSKSLLELQTHLAGSTQLSEEDAAAVKEAANAHQLMAAAAGQSVGGLDAAAQAKLNDQVAALQDAQANQELAASLQAVAAAQAGVSRGVVSSLSGLIGSGLINPGQAGALNAQIQSQANAGFAGIRGQGLSGASLTFATAQLERQITEPFRQLQQIEVDMTREAQEQHRSAQGASKEWNKAQKDAEAAAKATRKALESVEGLFSPSKVTQQQLDIAAAGGAVNLPDDFLRRFRDVSENFEKNGFRDDFGQTQLAEARAALERIGVQPLEDLKGLFAQFEEAWTNLSLFSSKDNLALINKDAVRQQLDLQTKMEEGRKNIFELFGVAIDDATEAVSGGGGGIPPIDQEALQKRIEAAQQAFIEQILQGLGVGPGGTSDAALATIVTGAGGGQSSGLEGLRQGFDNATSTADILRTAFDDTATTADILREQFLSTTEAAEVLATKVNDIPPVIWEDHIDEFPKWKEDIIDAFPGWEHWLGPEKVAAPPPPTTTTNGPPLPTEEQMNTLNALGFAGGTNAVPRAGYHLVGEEGPELVRFRGGERVYSADATASMLGSMLPNVSSPVAQALTSPASVTNTTVVNNWNLAVNSRESAGSLVRDFAILKASAAP